MKALQDVIKQRNHEQHEVEKAYEQIELSKERIQSLLDSIQRKEQLIKEYDYIIELVEKERSEENGSLQPSYI